MKELIESDRSPQEIIREFVQKVIGTREWNRWVPSELQDELLTYGVDPLQVEWVNVEDGAYYEISVNQRESDLDKRGIERDLGGTVTTRRGNVFINVSFP